MPHATRRISAMQCGAASGWKGRETVKIAPPSGASGIVVSALDGPTEGVIQERELLKRQRYGRADFDLLRCRMLAGA